MTNHFVQSRGVRGNAAASLGKSGTIRTDSILREWLLRIGPHLAQLPQHDELDALMRLHYRCRFDPRSLDPGEMEQFSARVDAWLARAR